MKQQRQTRRQSSHPVPPECSGHPSSLSVSFGELRAAKKENPAAPLSSTGFPAPSRVAMRRSGAAADDTATDASWPAAKEMKTPPRSNINDGVPAPCQRAGGKAEGRGRQENALGDCVFRRLRPQNEKPRPSDQAAQRAGVSGTLRRVPPDLFLL
jgi:hypothetical protein